MVLYQLRSYYVVGCLNKFISDSDINSEIAYMLYTTVNIITTTYCSLYIIHDIITSNTWHIIYNNSNI